MKTQHFLFALTGMALMLFTACESDSFVDRATPEVTKTLDARAAAFSMLSTVDLTLEFPEATADNGLPGRFDVSPTPVSREESYVTVRGTGEGSSNMFGDGFVRVRLRYFPSTQRLVGDIDMAFEENGSTMQILVDGSGPPFKLEEYDAYALALSTTLVDATGELEGTTLDATTYVFDVLPLIYLNDKNFTANFLTEGSLDH